MSLQEFIKDLSDKKAQSPEYLLRVMLAEAATIKCKFCSGLGHHVGQCSSLKIFDKSLKNKPLLKKKWGFVKAEKKTGGKTLCVKRAATTSIQTLELEV